MKLIRWDCCSVVPSVSCACPLHPSSFHPQTATAWPHRNLTPPPGLLAAPPGTCQPFTLPLGEHLEGEEGQTRRPWRSTDTVTDTAIELSDRFSLFTHQIRTPLPKSAALRVSVAICRHISVSFLSFILLFDRTHRSRRLWCMHSWSWQSRPGNVWFTDPLLTYWFDLPFTFQRPGILTAQGLLRSDSACLTMVENRSEYAASWLTDTVNGCDTSCMKPGQKSRFLTTFAMDLHLLTPFVTKNFASLVLVKYYSTLQFYWNNNILAVKLQAERKDIYLKLRQPSSYTPGARAM